MQNECMTAVRLRLQRVSEARVKWVLARGARRGPKTNSERNAVVGAVRPLPSKEDPSETCRKRLHVKREDLCDDVLPHAQKRIGMFAVGCVRNCWRTVFVIVCRLTSSRRDRPATCDASSSPTSIRKVEEDFGSPCKKVSNVLP